MSASASQFPFSLDEGLQQSQDSQVLHRVAKGSILKKGCGLS